MTRALFIVAVLALIGRATFFLSPTRPDCTESCPDRDVNGECMPTCTCSDCEEDQAPLAVLHLMLECPYSGRQHHAKIDISLPPSAEPREILHIPKAPVALA
ncbi:MAG TPA: hypothetical protein VH877_31865 [Polyangia bacterium]|nr:hypothetical protein [Polyangia bacterium]